MSKKIIFFLVFIFLVVFGVRNSFAGTNPKPVNFSNDIYLQTIEGAVGPQINFGDSADNHISSSDYTGAAFYAASAGTVSLAESASSISSIGSYNTESFVPSSLTNNSLNFGNASYSNDQRQPNADFFHFRSVARGTVNDEVDNLLVFNRSGFGMRLFQQTENEPDDPYSAYKDILLSDSNGTGNTNYLPKYTSGDKDTISVGQSAIYDSGDGVGIYNNNPNYALDVAGYVNASGFCIGGSCISSWPTGGSGGTGTGWATSSTNIYNTNNGNVGIGTTTPSGKLQVVVGSNVNLIFDYYTAGGSPRIKTSGGNGFLYFAPGNQYTIFDGVSTNNSTLQIQSYSSGVAELRFYNGGGGLNKVSTYNNSNLSLLPDGGNIGIGLTNPAQKLDVNGSVALSGNANNFIYNNTKDGNSNSTLYFQSSAANANSGFYTTGNSASNYGSLGAIYGSGWTNNNIRLNHDGTNGNIITGAGNVVISPSSGKVGIGTTNPQTTLDVNGTTTALAYLSVSDARFKTNVKKITNVLTKLEKINPVSYDWDREKFPARNFSGGRQIGFIAQEVEKQFPEIVTTMSDGYKEMMYDRFNSILLAAVKEQQAQIENLENRISFLEKVKVKK